MTFGVGFSAQFLDLRLFVEVKAEGIRAAAYDKLSRKWAWQEFLATFDEGKEKALQIAWHDQVRSGKSEKQVTEARNQVTWVPLNTARD